MTTPAEQVVTPTVPMAENAPMASMEVAPESHWPTQTVSAPAAVRPAGALDRALEAARTGDPAALARYLVLRRGPGKNPS